MRVLLALIAFFAIVRVASARPPYLNELSAVYPDTKVLSTTKCQTCHNNGRALNSFGKDYFEIVRRSTMDQEEAYTKLAELDSDGDGVSNLEEMINGTNPGKAEKTTPDADSNEQN